LSPRIRALVILAGALAVAAPAHANPPDTFGFGSRETAMGGAVSADVRGVSASYYNPAGLVLTRGLDIQIGYFRADHFLYTNGKDNGVDAVKGFDAGLVAPGKVLSIPFAFGVAVHLPDERISRVRALPQETPRWELYDNRNQRLFLAANLAVEPLPWLQIGGGLSFMSSTTGRLDITGSANIFSPDDSELRHEVDADLTAVRYPQAGVRVALSDRVALAAVYRGEFKLSLDLAAHLQGDISGLTTALYDIQTSSIDNFLPQQAVLGATWRVTDDLSAGLDLTWINWSAYVPPVPQLNVVLDIPPPAGGWPAGITPPTAPVPPKIVPLVMHDRVVPRLGVEHRFLRRPKIDLFGRGGLEIARSPIAPQTGVTSYIDRDRYSVSLGAGVALRQLAAELPGTLSLDVHVQYSVLPEETTDKASAADFVGDYTAGGHIWNVGATLGLLFDSAANGRGK
jgi:Outer membrane protein transport protein (OMPP1/FadL/TodX)